MANHITAQILFGFQYDGTSNSISVDTRKGAVIYQETTNGSSLHPLFSAEATSAINVGISNPLINVNGGLPIPTTATVSGGVIDVAIPSGLGLAAGTLTVYATLVY